MKPLHADEYGKKQQPGESVGTISASAPFENLESLQPQGPRLIRNVECDEATCCEEITRKTCEGITLKSDIFA